MAKATARLPAKSGLAAGQSLTISAELPRVAMPPELAVPRPGHLRFNLDSLPLNEERPSTGMTGRGRYDIHGYPERVKRYLALIAESNIPDEDKKALTEFSEVLRAQGLHIGSVIKYLYHLRVCAESMLEFSPGGSLKSADARAITKLEAWINGSPRFKPETRKDFVVLKRFFQWLRAPPRSTRDGAGSTSTPWR